MSAVAGAEEVAPLLALSLFGFSALAVSLFGFSALALELELELGLLGALAPPDAEPELAGALDAAELDAPAEEPGAVDGEDGVALLALEEPGVFDDEVRSGP